MNKPSFSMISLGCARSLVDSEKMVHQLQHGGFRMVAEGSKESVSILNTCSFIKAAIDETEANIKALIERKSEGAFKYLAVVGCYPSRFKKHELEEKFPGVDLWLTTQEEGTLETQLSKLVFSKKFTPQKKIQYTKLTPSHFSYLKISEGCNNWCSFCTIPKIRGVHTSKTIETVLAEARQQLSFGAKELNIIAEDTTCWGEDLYGKPSLPLLLKELAKLPVDWIRLMYIFPNRVDSELISVIKNTPNICNYLDMPVQHVCTDLLAAMNRRHDKSFLEGILREFKQEIPDIAIRTTFIMGFPGETEAHMTELLDFMEANPFSKVGSFGYSEERETKSARMANKVDPLTTQKRINQVMQKQYEIVQAMGQSMIGQVLPVLVDSDGTGRSYREAPDVDGKIILHSDRPISAGQFYPVKITGVQDYDLLGQVVHV